MKEQVGVYLDESVISLSLFTPDLDLFDLNRVETLRGPQGTLFGSGSVGGTIRYITNQPELGRLEGSVEGNVNLLAGGDIGGHLKGMINVPLGRRRGDPRGRLLHRNMAASSTRSGRRGGENVNDGHRAGGRLSLRFEPTPGIRDHAARRLSGDPRRRLQPPGGLQPLRQPVHDDAAAGDLRRARAISCCCARASRTTPCSPT